MPGSPSSRNFALHPNRMNFYQECVSGSFVSAAFHRRPATDRLSRETGRSGTPRKATQGDERRKGVWLLIQLADLQVEEMTVEPQEYQGTDEQDRRQGTSKTTPSMTVGDASGQFATE
jgi:hypothetical protein